MPRPRAGEAHAEAEHLHAALDVVCRRWRADVVWCLRSGPLRFNALLATLSPVTHKVLTEQLRALEHAGVVKREVGFGGGRRVGYCLTSLGAELPPILEQLRTWGAAHEHAVREYPATERTVAGHAVRQSAPRERATG